MSVSLTRVDADDGRLARLLQLYIYEWSARIPLSIGDDGLYAYDLEPYRDRESRAAYLVFAAPGSAPVGFALVIREPGCWSVEDFFILAGVRRRGVGRHAAQALFATQPGRWTFTVRSENPEGLAFWRRAVPDAHTQAQVGEDGITRTRFTFSTQ